MQTQNTPATFTMHVSDLWNGEALRPEDKIDLSIEPGATAWTVRVSAPFYGDPPPRAPAGPTWALWEHEVVEWFIAGPGEEYLELELGPHGHHLALKLSGVRNIIERELPLSYHAQITGSRWTGTATFPASWLPPGPWRVNAYGIHGAGAQRAYLAAYPSPGAEPDFHRLDTFRPLPSR